LKRSGCFWQFSCNNGDDGLAFPNTHFVSDGFRLYSTAEGGGPHGPYGGGVFAVQPDGTGFDILHRFDQNSANDGNQILAGLALENGVLYGTTLEGGANNLGTVFSIRTDATDFKTIHHFSGQDGATCAATPFLNHGRLYGTTMNGGAYNNGVVFSMGTDGSDYRVLHDFTADESGPKEGVVLADDRLYGVTVDNGPSAFGVIYSLRRDGSDFQVLHRFNYLDGSWIAGRLLLWGHTFYGLASHGGDSECGVIFAFDLPNPNPIPAVTPWGVAVLILLGGGVGYWGIRRQALKIEN